MLGIVAGEPLGALTGVGFERLTSKMALYQDLKLADFSSLKEKLSAYTKVKNFKKWHHIKSSHHLSIQLSSLYT